MTTEKVKKSIVISSELDRVLKKISKELHLSQSKVIEEAILEYEKKRKLKRRKKAFEYLKENPIKLNIDKNEIKIVQRIKGNMDV